MQSFGPFGLLLEEQWPAEGPKMARRPFFAPWITPPMLGWGSKWPQTLHAGVSRRPASFGAVCLVI